MYTEVRGGGLIIFKNIFRGFLEFICQTKLDFGPQVYFGRNAEAFLISDFGF